MKKIENWTVSAVVGVTPDGICDGFTFLAPRLIGNVMSHRRIHNHQQPAAHNECGISMSTDIVSSEILEVHNDVNGVSITTSSGSVFQLVGEPRPSFNTHCKAMGVDSQVVDAVHQLIKTLRARGGQMKRMMKMKSMSM